MQCRHLDDNRLNNNLSNLAWGTQKQNAEDRDRNGKTYRREKHPNHKLTNEIVGFIRDRAKELPRYGRTPIIRDEVEKTFGVALGKYIVNAAINYRVWKD